MSNFRFRSHEHLRRPEDFRRVYEGRASASEGPLVAYARPNQLPHGRLGMSVSRKVGNAVVRNRVRRLLREAYRLNRPTLPVGFDFVIVARDAELPAMRELLPGVAALLAQAVARAENRRGQANADPA